MARVGDPRKGNSYAAKPPPPEPADGWLYRLRFMYPDPWGDIPEPLEGTLAEVLHARERDEQDGLASVIEYRVAGVPWAAWHRPLTMQDLKAQGLAEERTHNIRQRLTGEEQQQTRWEITPEGWERLRERDRALRRD